MEEKRIRTSMSVVEMGKLLGLSKTEAYWLVKKNYFRTIEVGNTMRVMIDSFETWYANQFKYKKVDGTLPGDELKKTTYSVGELGQLLGLKEAASYALISKGHFDVVEVLGKRRITKDSFDKWYSSQKEYRTLEDQAREADVVASTYSVLEIAKMLTWDCVDISPMSIKLGQASIFVNKELQRVNREAMAELNDKDISISKGYRNPNLTNTGFGLWFLQNQPCLGFSVNNRREREINIRLSQCTNCVFINTSQHLLHLEVGIAVHNRRIRNIHAVPREPTDLTKAKRTSKRKDDY